MSKNFIFLGAPGVGKGTVAGLVSGTFGLKHISTGDMLRGEIARGTQLGLQAKEIMEQGKLVSDELVTSIVGARLSQDDVKNDGVILDGFPRTVRQAELLEEELKSLNMSIDAAVLFELDESEIIKRLTARRVCPSCQAIYNVIYSAPKQDGICDKCGSGIIQRSDDSEQTVVARLKVYTEQTAPLVCFYEKLGLLVKLVADGTPQENADMTVKLLGIG